MWRLIGSSFLSLLLAFSQPATAATEEDPWEGFNRAMFSFNDAIDGAILKPVAKGYKAVTPNLVQKGVSNFFSNLGEVNNVVNNALQAKPVGAAVSTGRFLINSTIGILGIFDVASYFGMKEYEEDFGQTLGYWGVNTGPYLVVPFLGPSTVRDTTGFIVDQTTYPEAEDYLNFNLTWEEDLALLALDVVQTRAHLLQAESFIVGDRYSFIRDVYLQSRESAVPDGNVPAKKASEDVLLDDADSWGEDSWGDETEEADSWGDEPDAVVSWGDA